MILTCIVQRHNVAVDNISTCHDAALRALAERTCELGSETLISAQAKELVEKMLVDLGLVKCADTYIGHSSVRG